MRQADRRHASYMAGSASTSGTRRCHVSRSCQFWLKRKPPWPFATTADVAGAETQGTRHQDVRIPAGIQRALAMMRLSPGTQRPWGPSTQPCPQQVPAAPPPSPRKPSRGHGDSRELAASLQGSPKTKEELSSQETDVRPFDYSEKDIS